LALFCLRYMVPQDRWSDRAAKISFWSLNLGLAWMVFATLFPLGILQLYHSVNSGYFDARSLKFLTNRENTLLEWMRFPGDVLLIVGGIVPILYLSWLAVRHMAPRATLDQPDESLFTEVVRPQESR
jgi:nitric oxide reductase subunit B